MITHVIYCNWTKQYYFINKYFLLIISDTYKELVQNIIKRNGGYHLRENRFYDLNRKTLFKNSHFVIMKFWGVAVGV